MADLLNMILHIDQTLGVWVNQYGAWVYLVLFLIVFAETGLIVMPFLPGDSLLFIAGAFGAAGSMNVGLVTVLLLLAAILGNTVNFLIGRTIGKRVYTADWRFLDRNALMRTHVFYEKHGGKALVLARFIPVVRAFAPFVAGVAEMSFARFQVFNVAGALLWVLLLVLAGYFFGNIPFIKVHLNTIVLVGLAAAAVPVGLGVLVKLARRK
ncbi:VTT domain-containing protein [Bordetella sp. FB-8]|uniref:VTT domain-containing protein n=1 Tax=Bordetella sp. FB-8 TaxID=1159870 RepID=UPI00036A303E|nr:VTT domain-containing protein [Bordetella sp. FB-8]